MEKEFTQDEAIKSSRIFLKEVRELSKKHGLTFNSDTGDIYLSFKKADPGEGNHWGYVRVGWKGDGTGICVTDKIVSEVREEKLAKINKETDQELTMEYIEEGAKNYGSTLDGMLDFMLNEIEESK